jgi:hypothetical protein
MYLRVTDNVASEYSVQRLREDNSNVSFPEVISSELLASYNVYSYSKDTKPSIDKNVQYLEEGDFYQDSSDAWFRRWSIVNKPEDTAESNIRYQRDELLQECDWTQLPDAPVDKAAWATYRQSLRDVTSQAGFPYSVTWPTQP